MAAGGVGASEASSIGITDRKDGGLQDGMSEYLGLYTRRRALGHVHGR